MIHPVKATYDDEKNIRRTSEGWVEEKKNSKEIVWTEEKEKKKKMERLLWVFNMLIKSVLCVLC